MGSAEAVITAGHAAGRALKTGAKAGALFVAGVASTHIPGLFDPTGGQSIREVTPGEATKMAGELSNVTRPGQGPARADTIGSLGRGRELLQIEGLVRLDGVTFTENGGIVTQLATQRVYNLSLLSKDLSLLSKDGAVKIAFKPSNTIEHQTMDRIGVLAEKNGNVSVRMVGNFAHDPHGGVYFCAVDMVPVSTGVPVSK